MHQAGSISNELVESQMSSLKEEIEHLRTELEKSRTEVEEKKSVELDLKLQSTELKDANDRLSALQAHNEKLEANLHEANEENRKLKVTTTSLPQTSDVDTKSTDKLLKEGRDILSSLPDSDIRESLARDLEGLEKADLSKDDISSLLALIKGKSKRKLFKQNIFYLIKSFCFRKGQCYKYFIRKQQHTDIAIKIQK